MARHRHRTCKKGGIGDSDLVDLFKFCDRLKALYSHWNDTKVDFWASADAFVVETLPRLEDRRFLMSSAFSIWLFGYEIPGMMMVFMKKRIYLLCDKESRSFELLIKAAKHAVGAEGKIRVWKKKKNGDNAEESGIMNSIFPSIRDNRSPSIVGHIAAEASEGGKVLEKWNEGLGTEGFQLADISAGLGDLFVVKEERELVCVKRAGYLSAKVMNNVVVPKLRKVISCKEKKKDVDTTLMHEIEEALLQPSIKANVMLKSRNVDTCCHPDVQSFCSSDELAYYNSADVIKCSIGSRYKGYCSYVSRSFLVDPNPSQTRAYEVLLKAQEAAIAALRPGNRAGAVYVAAASLISLEAPYLVKHLTKSVGTGIGLEFQESALDLNETNDRLVKAGMVFNVCLCLENMKATDENSFSLLLADTVVVYAEGTEVVTQSISNAVKDVTYSLSEDSDQVSGGGEEQEEQKGGPLIMPDKELNWRQHLAEALAPRKVVSPKKLKLLDRPQRSPGLWICHPHFGGVGRKRAGALEAHANGFRFVNQWQENVDNSTDDDTSDNADTGDRADDSTDDSTDDDTEDDTEDDADIDEERGFADIMFANIKLAFYYNTKSPYGLMLHFCLHDPIKVGNEMTKNVQFYVEMVDEGQVLNEEGGRIAQRVPKHSGEWMDFVSYVNMSYSEIGFALLDPSLRFEGMLRESESPSIFRVAGYHLVEMTSLPFLVVKMEDIRMVKFERFDLGERQQEDFDVAIVLEGLNKDELRIESISYTSLGVVKDLLRLHGIRVKLGEHNKLKATVDDPDSGWKALYLVWQEEEEALKEWEMKSRDAVEETTKKTMEEMEAGDADEESSEDSELDEVERRLNLHLFGAEGENFSKEEARRARGYGNEQATSSSPPSKRLKSGDEGGLDQM